MNSGRGSATRRKRTAEEEATRNDLFASDTLSSLRHRKAASEEQEAQSVTEGLVELRQMMHGQVQHAQGALGVLAISSGKLQETKSGMEEIGSNIKVGQGLISKLGRRDITDKVLIFLAFIFFISVVLYVIRKRIIG
ncbi:Vesicle transport protein SEC20, partial [Geodia barretti]